MNELKTRSDYSMKRPKLTSSPISEQSYVKDDAENTDTNSTASTEAPPMEVSDSIGPATMEYIVSQTFI